MGAFAGLFAYCAPVNWLKLMLDVDMADGQAGRYNADMLRDCDDCGNSYDDAECVTYCPHPRFISPEDARRKDLAIGLINSPLCFKEAQPNPPVVRIESISHNGMVTLRGWPDEFEPSRFKVMEAA